MQYFKIWYVDSTLTGKTFEDWKNAPEDGVLAVYEKFDDGTGRMSAGSDWYWMLPDENVYQSGTSSFVKGEYLSHNAPADAILKKGKWVTDERMQEVLDEILILITIM